MSRTASAIFAAAHAATRKAVDRYTNCDYRTTFTVALRNEYAAERVEAAPVVVDEREAEDVAEQIAEAICADGDAAKVWSPHAGMVRVYITRLMSRGRRVDAGYIEVAMDLSVTAHTTRRSSYYQSMAARIAA